MPKEVTRWINEYEMPGFYRRFPRLLALQWLANRLLYSRSWLIRKEVSSSLRNFKKGVRMLDAGCGAGDFLVPFAAVHPDGSFTGVDQSAANLEMIRLYCQKRGLGNVGLIRQNLDSPVPGGPWQVVICTSVLHYLEDPDRFFSWIHANLDEGGHFLLYVPLNYRRRIPGYKLIREKLLSGVDYDHGRLREPGFTSEGLKRSLIASGLTIGKVKWLYGPVGQVAYEISSLAILMIKKAPWLLAVPGTLIYFPIIQPIVLLLLGIDYLLPNIQGNGLFIKATRKSS